MTGAEEAGFPIKGEKCCFIHIEEACVSTISFNIDEDVRDSRRLR